MAHEQQKEFCLSVKNKFPSFFKLSRVLDCGSLDINGNNRYLFSECSYLGIDLGVGSNVDIVTPIHLFKPIFNNYDTIISTECFEHDIYYKASITNIIRLLRPGGLFLFTCATEGRPEHGTVNQHSNDSPFTNSYYKNLTEKDIREFLNLEEIFQDYEFSINNITHDLYFWGIKKV